MNDVGNEASILIDLEQAAELAGVSTATLQIYIAGGDLAADPSGKFAKDDVLKLSELQKSTVDEIRHKAIEKLSAETVIVRRAIEHIANRYANLQNDVDTHTRTLASQDARVGEAESRIHAQSDSLMTQSDRISNLQSQSETSKRSIVKLQTDIDEQAKLIELLKNVSELGKRQSEADQQTIKQLKQSVELLQSLVESHRHALEEQTQIVSNVSSELAETRVRVDGIVVQQMVAPSTDKPEKAAPGPDAVQIAALQDDIYKRLNKIQDSLDSVTQARSQLMNVENLVQKNASDQVQELEQLRTENRQTKDLVRNLTETIDELKKQLKQVSAEVKKRPSAAEEEPTMQADAVATPMKDKKEKEEVNPSPAQFGVVREIEFNTLIERMGYQRVDNQKDASNIVVPHNDAIRKFLAKTELGCDPDEVEFRGITRAGWNMVQYQRVERKSGRRGWIGANS